MRHGGPALCAKPNGEQGEWALQANGPEERFPHLAVELVLKPGQYLVLGSSPERAGSLGQYLFVDIGAGSQQVLVLRSGAAAPVADTALAAGGGPWPLALQSLQAKPPPPPVTPPLNPRLPKFD